MTSTGATAPFGPGPMAATSRGEAATTSGARSRTLERRAREPERKPDPPAEVGEPGRSVPAQVADEDLRERTGRRRGILDPLVRCDDVLLAARCTLARNDGAEHDEPPEAQCGENEVRAHAGRVDAGVREHRADLATGEPVVAAEHRPHSGLGAGEHVVVDAEAAVHTGGLPELPARRDAPHPSEVVRIEDVHGSPLRPRPDALAALEGRIDVGECGRSRRAHGERPPAARELLRLRRRHVPRGDHARGGVGRTVRAHPRRPEALGIHDAILHPVRPAPRAVCRRIARTAARVPRVSAARTRESAQSSCKRHPHRRSRPPYNRLVRRATSTDPTSSSTVESRGRSSRRISRRSSA
nr:hypothetical protein [Microbacterium lacticum]